MDKKVLGKGLSALITQNLQEEPASDANQVEISRIRPNRYQPRQNFDQATLKELSSSIKEKGVIQPILLRRVAGGYELIAGERRFHAAKLAGLSKIPAIVKDISDIESLEIALIENIQREDLNIIDQANAFKRLLDEFNFTQERLAQSIGKDRSSVSNILRLLALPSKIQGYLKDGAITFGHARAILALNHEGMQVKFAEDVVKKGLSVRQIEGLINKDHSKRQALKAKHSADVSNLEDQLRKVLGTKVSIKHTKKRGKIIIEYYSLDDLQRILNIIKSS